MTYPLAGLSVLPGARPAAPAVRLDQPALAPAGGPPFLAPPWDDGTRQAMVQFLDGTWRLCRLVAWRQDSGTWVCDLRWGVSGRIVQAAYAYDAARVLRAGSLGVTRLATRHTRQPAAEGGCQALYG